MAKKKVEVENIVIDDEIQETPLASLVQKEEKEEVQTEASEPNIVSDESGLVNCLRNEKIIVRFVARPTSMVSNPKHILYGGMADNATRYFVVPRLNTGMFKNVLTDSEKAFLENAMGLEYNALSVYKKKDNFWDDSNPMGIGRVILHKQDNYLDLSIPEDYIKYKILLANKNQICPSLKELRERPRATYQFVIISEKEETNTALNEINSKQRCYMEYGKIEDDIYTLRTVVELLEGRPISEHTKADYLKVKIDDNIQKDPRKFLSVVKDELLPAKVLIRKALDAGLIGKKNDAYYLRADGSPLCEINEVSTLNNAAKYISSVRHQDLKYTLEARVK